MLPARHPSNTYRVEWKDYENQSSILMNDLHMVSIYKISGHNLWRFSINNKTYTTVTLEAAKQECEKMLGIRRTMNPTSNHNSEIIREIQRQADMAAAYSQAFNLSEPSALSAPRNIADYDGTDYTHISPLPHVESETETLRKRVVQLESKLNQLQKDLNELKEATLYKNRTLVNETLEPNRLLDI